MKNLIYLAYVKENRSDGVFKKIFSQCLAFEENGYKVFLYIVKDDDSFVLYEVSDGKLILYKSIKRSNVEAKGIFRKLKLQENYLDTAIEVINELKFKNVYMRKMPLSRMYIDKIKKIKKTNLKLVCEIPTYPYINELKTMGKWINIINEIIYFNKFTNYVDRITVILSNNITLKNNFYEIQNGIPNGNYKISSKVYNENIIELLGVGYIYKYHGYDRVIKGLSDYYKYNNDIRVNFNIIGNGPEIENLKELSKKLDVEKYVRFLGEKSGSELDDIFDKCDVAIGSIGLHRKKAMIDTSIKIKEYAFRGIPFVISASKGLENLKYIKIIEATEDPVNILDVVDFYKSIKDSDYKEELRKYSENNFTWKSILSQVFKF